MASFPSSPSLLDQTSMVDVESEVEDEVDQLDSDTDVDDFDLDASSKKSESGGGERIPGHSVLPILRLENIIQADGVTGNLALSKEGLFVLSVATEEFVKKMVQAGQRQASSERRSIISYRDMAATTQQYQEFMFLNDTIPAPLSLSEALLMREAKERELLEEDPVMMASAPSAGCSSFSAHKIKGKSRAMNGQDKTNGSGSAAKRERKSDTGGQRSHRETSNDNTIVTDGAYIDWADGQAPLRAGADHLRPVLNGVSVTGSRPSPLDSSVVSRSGTVTPVRSPDGHTESPSAQPPPFHVQDEVWPGQYTGPASGFLQGPGGPFGRVAQNPGRTIYSQQHRAL